jgi:hypothetical protein
MRLLGDRACARLLDRIDNPGLRPRVEVLATELVLRASCGCPSGTETRRPVKPAATRPHKPSSRAAALPAAAAPATQPLATQALATQLPATPLPAAGE